jgi:hypothetical protein
MNDNASIWTLYKLFTNQGKSVVLTSECLCCIVLKIDAEIVTQNFISESEFLHEQLVPVYPPAIIDKDEMEYLSSIALIEQSDLIRYLLDSHNGKTNLKSELLEPFMNQVRIFNVSNCRGLRRDHST